MRRLSLSWLRVLCAALWSTAAAGAPEPASAPATPRDLLTLPLRAAPDSASAVTGQATPPAAPGRADLDPENDEIVAPPDAIADCEARLADAGIEYAPASLPLRAARGKVPACGAPQAVLYRRGPERIRYNSAPILTCGMALALARFESVLNEEAKRSFGQPVARIEHLGTYNCRKMARFQHMVSEHSYGNAIDIKSITLKNGRSISILSHFGDPAQEPARPEARFLRTLSRRLYDDGVFSVVITPFFDSLHKNHFHLDLARYRIDGAR